MIQDLLQISSSLINVFEKRIFFELLSPMFGIGQIPSLKNFFLFQILFRVFGIGQIPSPYVDPCRRHFHNIQSRAQRINMNGNIPFIFSFKFQANIWRSTTLQYFSILPGRLYMTLLCTYEPFGGLAILEDPWWMKKEESKNIFLEDFLFAEHQT